MIALDSADVDAIIDALSGGGPLTRTSRERDRKIAEKLRGLAAESRVYVVTEREGDVIDAAIVWRHEVKCAESVMAGGAVDVAPIRSEDIAKHALADCVDVLGSLR